MDKKNLKFYETPAVEAVEVELEGHLLEGSATLPEYNEEPMD